TFEGITEGTFLRGEACIFYQMGKYIERADQTTRILDMGYGRLGFDDDDAIVSAQWHVLLRSVSAYHAFRTRHPGPINPKRIATFLLYDEEFPRAVTLCIARFTQQLLYLQARTPNVDDSVLEAARRQVEFKLETGPGTRVTPSGLHRYLDELQRLVGQLAQQLRNCYSGGG
ncbi:MAG: alpha-E domain-containing protein, partial [Hyphomicrobiales bacterium]|nr:alpha-E domain-containing protein [Hyphomicrobiales bacterium]